MTDLRLWLHDGRQLAVTVDAYDDEATRVLLPVDVETRRWFVPTGQHDEDGRPALVEESP